MITIPGPKEGWNWRVNSALVWSSDLIYKGMPENPSLSSVGMNGILCPKSCLQDGGFRRYNPMHEKDGILEWSSYETQTEVSYRTDTEIPEAGADRETREPVENPAAGGSELGDPLHLNWLVFLNVAVKSKDKERSTTLLPPQRGGSNSLD
jgi:hypothetical protein